MQPPKLSDARGAYWGHLPTPDGSPSRSSGALDLITPIGFGDDEHPQRADGLQTRLCDLGCGAKVDIIADRYADQNDWPAWRQLQDLRAPGTDHSWLWLAATPAGSAFCGQEFCTAARLRIGAPIIETEQECAVCGGQVDVRGLHSLCCAPGESTRGHNWVCNSLLHLSSLSDSSSVAEPRGLVPSRPTLRPADIFTTTAFGSGAAVDVSIVSPDGEGAGADACQAAADGKMKKYGEVLAELREEGIRYMPTVWSCWGRPDTQSVEAVRVLAGAAARRRGLGDPTTLVRRAHAVVGTQIWRRAACMVHACLGRTPVEDVDALLPLGHDEEEEPLGSAAPRP